MIVRVWHARALASNAARYERHFRDEVARKLASIPGYQGAELLGRLESGVMHIVVQTRWDSMESVRTFAGQDLDRAVVEPAAQAWLSDFDDRVRHYELIVSSAPSAPADASIHGPTS
jgi:heme-degrading monooxygenase HmoA